MTSWGREDESSSSLSTTSSSQSRRPVSEIDVLEVRNRIVQKIMAKKQREESMRSQQSSASASQRRSRAPLADLQQSADMELTLPASTSGVGPNLNLSTGSAKRGHQIFSSTPLPGRFEDPRQPKSSSQVPVQPKSPSRGRRPRASDIREEESEEEEAPPPPPRAPTPKAPTRKKKGRPKKETSRSEAKRSSRIEKAPSSQDPALAAFPASDDEAQVAQDLDSDRDEEEERMAGPSTRQTSRVSPEKSPRKKSADRAKMPPPSSTVKPPKVTPAKPSKDSSTKPSKATPGKPATKTPTKSSRQSEPSTSVADSSQNRASRSSSRRKAAPRKASPNTRRINAFKELRKLQTDTGYLIPRLPFMRVVREIATQISAENTDFRFTVDAMEALQTATEFYLTSVFTDAAALANHARRVTIMPRDLDLLRKLRLVDA